LSKIKDNVSSDNWRLRVSNIKKVIEGVNDFYDNVLCIGLPINVSLPDASLIGREKNKKELGRLLQLILGAAVNCDHKEHHIAMIMSLDTDTQLIVKNAIEELFLEGGGGGGGGGGRTRSATTDSMNWDSLAALNDGGSAAVLRQEIKRLQEELTSVIESREKVSQEMFDMKRELSSVKEENVQLSMENDKLSDRIRKNESTSLPRKTETNANTSESSDASLKEIFVNKLQTRVDTLTDDLFKMENAKEEVRIKNELLEKELMEMRFKNEDLTRKANEARNLKDELDMLKQQAERTEKQEQTIDMLKKRLEEALEFKRKMKFSGDDNIASESKLKIQLEEEMRKNSSLKNQNENLKKQVSEMTSSLAQLNHSKDTADFEVRMFKEKFEYLAEEKEALLKEIVELRSSMKDKRPSFGDNFIPVNNSNPASGLNLNHELNNSDHEQRIRELERENHKLRRQIEKHSSSELNGVVPSHEGHVSGSINSSSKIIESLRTEVFGYQEKVSHLEEVLHKKQEELTDLETRYRKAVNKAKQVAKVLEPISMSSSNSSISSMANLEQLALELQIKDKQLQELQAEHDKTQTFKEFEERLMSVAFHSLSSKLQRSSAEERMFGGVRAPSNVSNNTPPPTGPSSGSFLARQRQRFIGSSSAHTTTTQSK